MKTLKWVVPIFVVLGVTLCLSALNGPEDGPKDADTSLPPGVSEKDWHALSDNFGFILRVTKEPQFVVSPSTNDGKQNLSSAAKEKIRKLLAGRKKKLQESKKENATTKEPMGLKDFYEELEGPRKDDTAGLQKSRYYDVGEAQALFYARKDKKWYKVTTPPPPIEARLLYQ